MKRKIERVYFHLILFLVNHFFCGTHAFGIKRALLNSLKGVTLGKRVKIVAPVWFAGELTVDSDVWIGRNFNIEGNGKVFIGTNVNIAPNVTIYTGSHQIGSSKCRAGKGTRGTVKIENGCWICGSSIFLPDTVVSEGTVVAAGSVVRKLYPANVLIAGNPAVVKQNLQ